MTQRKLFLYIATSMDGYIARKNDDLDWLPMEETPGEDLGYKEFMSGVDTVFIGRRTYDKVLSMGHQYPSDKEFYVITRTPKAPEGNVVFYSGDLIEFVKKLKAKEGKNIYCDGGAEIIHALMKEHLVDEYIITLIPIFLGDGIRLFKDGRPEEKLTLKSAKGFGKSGMVQLHYLGPLS